MDFQKKTLPLPTFRLIGTLVECDPGYALATVEVNGVSHHLELFQVEEDDDNIIHAVNEDQYTKVEGILNDWVEGNPTIITLDGRAWIAVMTPFQD